MKDIPRENWSPLHGETADNRVLTISFVGSVLIHGILMGLLFFGFDHTPRISMAPSAINVTMISTDDLPEPPPPPAMKTKTANLSPKSSEEAEAPLITEEEASEGEPDAQEEETPAADEPESTVPEPPAEEPETAAPEPTPQEPEVKKAALKKPTELPAPIPPVAKEQVVIKEKVVIKDAPKVEEKPPVKEKPIPREVPETTKETPKTAQAAPKDAETKPSAKDAEPKVIKAGAKNRKAANNQKSVITPSAARADSIKDAINKVKAKHGSGGQSGGSTLAANRTGSTAGGTGQAGGVIGATGKAGGVIGGTGRAGAMGGSINDIYKAQISYQIERNWAFSDSLTGGRKDLRTILVITILPTGEIQNTRYEQRSGNTFLDQSAYNAVMKSNPLPPLPRGLSEYTIALVFTPTGLN